MFVKDWMTRQVVTVGPDESISHAMRLMRERAVKHLPVVRDGAVVGVISDRDIRTYTPSKATALDIHEINYLLGKATVSDAMGARLTTTTADTPIEEAALLLLENGIGCLPVVDGGVLVGIVSDQDFYRALVDITGVRQGGHRICVTIEDRPGSIRELADLIRAHGFGLRGILGSYDKAPAGSRSVVIRTGLEGDFDAMCAKLTAVYPSAKVRKG